MTTLLTLRRKETEAQKQKNEKPITFANIEDEVRKKMEEKS
jgi:hypothetical protein